MIPQITISNDGIRVAKIIAVVCCCDLLEEAPRILLKKIEYTIKMRRRIIKEIT
jgi:hypothetical protein